MGKRGPKKTPTDLAKHRGIYREDRWTDAEPEPTKGIPPQPAHFEGKLLDAWEHYALILEDMGVLTLADGTALEMLAKAHCAYWEDQKLLDVEGSVLEADNGKQYLNPRVKAVEQHWSHLYRLQQEFGLTPAARTRVNKIEKPKKEENPFAALAALKVV